MSDSEMAENIRSQDIMIEKKRFWINGMFQSWDIETTTTRQGEMITAKRPAKRNP